MRARELTWEARAINYDEKIRDLSQIEECPLSCSKPKSICDKEPHSTEATLTLVLV